jgi:hypothetical protein
MIRDIIRRLKANAHLRQQHFQQVLDVAQFHLMPREGDSLVVPGISNHLLDQPPQRVVGIYHPELDRSIGLQPSQHLRQPIGKHICLAAASNATNKSGPTVHFQPAQTLLFVAQNRAKLFSYS